MYKAKHLLAEISLLRRGPLMLKKKPHTHTHKQKQNKKQKNKSKAWKHIGNKLTHQVILAGIITVFKVLSDS